MTIRNEIMVAFSGMVGPSLAFAFLGNLFPLAIWLAACVLVLVYGKEEPHAS